MKINFPYDKVKHSAKFIIMILITRKYKCSKIDRPSYSAVSIATDRMVQGNWQE